MNAQVDILLNKAKKWQPELKKLRQLVLDCGLTETVKWGKPCYVFQGGNVVLIFGFKEYCGLLFFKGSLIDDPHGILIQSGKNSQAGRQIRFMDVDQIEKMDTVLKIYIHEALKVEKAGIKVNFIKQSDRLISDEFKKRLDDDPAFKAAFQALTPGRQRGYLLFIDAAKQSRTRQGRIDKCIPKILQGRGLNE